MEYAGVERNKVWRFTFSMGVVGEEEEVTNI